MPIDSSSVCAIVVAYQADVATLERVLTAALAQVGGLVLIDHGRQPPGFHALLEQPRMHAIHVRSFPDNPGLAAGLNRGIEYARAQGFSFVLLLDQDSIAAPTMVPRLLAGYQALSAQVPVAAVGPQWIDSRTNVGMPFIRFGFPFNHKIAATPGQRMACDFLISSGSLIPLAVLEHIGSMDESLFIDGIDLDWCMRATTHGYHLYGITDARMSHTIGDHVKTVPWTRWMVFIHSPLRLYYIMRNRVLLYQRKHVPWRWVAQDIPRLLLKLAVMAVLIAPRRAHINAMYRGIVAGLRGRSGRTPEML